MERHGERKGEADAGRAGKRKYEPPEILSQEVFETTALACLKVSAAQGMCSVGQRKAT